MNGNFFFDKAEVSREEMQSRLAKVHQSAPEAKVFVRGRSRHRSWKHCPRCSICSVQRDSTRSRLKSRAKRSRTCQVPGGDYCLWRRLQNLCFTGHRHAGSVWAALGGAVAIHLTAVALAQKREPPPVDLSDIPTAVSRSDLAGARRAAHSAARRYSAPGTSTAARHQAGVCGRNNTSTETSQKHKRSRQSKRHKLLAAPAPMSISSAKALATYAPRPQYPYEARSRRITGSGTCVVTVDPGSGSVTSASMAQSIGNPILDNAATSAFRQWRFKPGTVSKVRIPITFTMSGASY